MARVEIPAPGDVVMDASGNALGGLSVTLVLAGTATAVTHYSALTGGTSTTGGLITSSTGRVTDASGNVRYIDSGAAVDMTVSGVTRRLEPLSAAVETSSLQIKEGTNAKMGSTALVAGSKVVTTTAVTASSRIYVTSNADGGTPGWLRVSTRTAGTSFTITSSSGTDTSTVSWLIVEPG